MPIFWLKHWVFRQSAVAAVFMISDGFRRPETTDEKIWFHRDWTLFKNNSCETCCNFPTLFEPECSRLTQPGFLHRLLFRRRTLYPAELQKRAQYSCRQYDRLFRLPYYHTIFPGWFQFSFLLPDSLSDVESQEIRPLTQPWLILQYSWLFTNL